MQETAMTTPPDITPAVKTQFGEMTLTILQLNAALQEATARAEAAEARVAELEAAQKPTE
jgi:hypothetical protein